MLEDVSFTAGVRNPLDLFDLSYQIDELVEHCRNIAKIIEPQLPNQFRHIPMLLYGVRPIPAEREAATATNAQSPPPDFSAPGWFNLNTYEPQNQVK